jgi:hypothetical protein
VAGERPARSSEWFAGGAVLEVVGGQDGMIQAALGYSLSQSLFLGPDNLVVEGPSDLLYMTAVSEHLREANRAHLDDRWVIVPVGGLEKVPSFVALLGAQLNVAVVVDGAASGTQRLNDMVDKRVIEAENVLALNEITETKEADLEDLFTEAFYVELLNACGVLSRVKLRDLPKGTRSPRGWPSTSASSATTSIGLRRTSRATRRGGSPRLPPPRWPASRRSSARDRVIVPTSGRENSPPLMSVSR